MDISKHLKYETKTGIFRTKRMSQYLCVRLISFDLYF